jgi:hypothetical protein
MAPDTVKGIQHIQVKKTELIAALKKNREQHQKDYDEAMTGYRDAMTEELKERLAIAEKREDVHHLIDLDVPENHTKDYDRLIGMLEMSVDDAVLLTQQEYCQYVMDDWAWKERFTNASQAYAVGNKVKR